MNTIRYEKEIKKASQLRDPDFAALKKCIDDMKGMRSMDAFAMDCKLTPNTLYRTVSGRRSQPMLPDHLDLMLENKNSESSVTPDMLYYADGLLTPSEADGKEVDYADIQAQIDALKSIRKKNISGRPRKGDTDDSEKEKIISLVQKRADRGDGTSVSFKEFIHDLTLYMSGLSEKEYGLLYQKRDDLFKDKWIVSVLKSYGDAYERNFEANRTAVETYCMRDEGLKDCIREAQYAKQLLDNALGVTSRVSQKLESNFFD